MLGAIVTPRDLLFSAHTHTHTHTRKQVNEMKVAYVHAFYPAVISEVVAAHDGVHGPGAAA